MAGNHLAVVPSRNHSRSPETLTDHRPSILSLFTFCSRWLILHLLPKVYLQTFTTSAISMPSSFPLAIKLLLGSHFFAWLTDHHDLQLLLENGCEKSFHQSLKILKSLFFFIATGTFSFDSLIFCSFFFLNLSHFISLQHKTGCQEKK